MPAILGNRYLILNFSPICPASTRRRALLYDRTCTAQAALKIETLHFNGRFPPGWSFHSDTCDFGTVNPIVERHMHSSRKGVRIAPFMKVSGKAAFNVRLIWGWGLGAPVRESLHNSFCPWLMKFTGIPFSASQWRRALWGTWEGTAVLYRKLHRIRAAPKHFLVRFSAVTGHERVDTINVRNNPKKNLHSYIISWLPVQAW